MYKKTFGKKDLKEILSYYDLGGFKTCSKIPKGENINIQIQTTKGRYHLKYFIQEKSERKNWLLYELLLTDYLSQRGIKVPTIIRTNDGSLYTKYKGRFCVIYKVIEGSVNYPLNQITVSQVGAFLGKFHRVIEGYKPRYRTTRGRFTPRTLYQILIKEALPKYRNEKLKQEILKKSKFIYRMRYSNLPKGPIHMDIDPQNFIFKNNKLQALIDFGDSLYGILLIDIARGAYEFCLNSGIAFNHRLLDVFLQKYQKYRPLTLEEKRAFVDFMKFTYIWKITDLIKNKLPDSQIRKRLEMFERIPEELSNVFQFSIRPYSEHS